MQVFETILAKTAQGLEQENIPYMVIGGQAVLVHGDPRFTRDIGITLGVDTDYADKIRNIARRMSIEPIEGMTDDFIRRNSVYSVEDPKTRIGIDFIFSFLPYERQAIKRAGSIRIGGTYVQFATAEDTIIHKLFAGRPRDIEDVKGIVNHKSNLDEQYLMKWLKDFSGVAGRDLVNEFKAILSETRKV